MSYDTFSCQDPTPEQLRAELDLKKKTGRVNIDTLSEATPIERAIINLLQDTIEQGNSLIDAQTLTYRSVKKHDFTLLRHSKIIEKLKNVQVYATAWSAGAISVVLILWEAYKTVFVHV